MDAKVEMNKDFARLDALLDEVHALAKRDGGGPQLVHALRNLAHLAGLLAACLSSNDAVVLDPDNDRTSA